MANVGAGGSIVGDASDAADLFAPLLASCPEEMVACIHLDAERRLLALTQHPGSIDEVELPVRAILAESLRLGAAGLIIAHNHPSGDPSPSQADRETTRILAETARRLGIRLYDHLVFGGGTWTSFRALGLL